jgi:opacity protein-like surface antigen
MKVAALILVLGTVILAPRADAQLFYIGVRAGAAIPTGVFADSASGPPEDRVLEAAKNGLGYGLDAGISLGPVGLYAGYDHIDFECDEQSCAAGGKYKLEGISAGARLAVPLIPIIKPWVKAGVTLHEVESRPGPASSFSGFKTERSPGYELGAGVDIAIAGGFMSLTPQVRYVNQKLEYRLPGSPDTEEREANFYTFDIGVRLRSPF